MSQTCSHIYDTGRACKSFAVKQQRYCVNHLRYRARRLRAAQARARGERFEFNLPPLESMHAVHSALSQLAEAITAGVIDRRSAHLLLSVLRVASSNLRHPDKWQPSLYESAEPAPEVDVAAEYGLPADLDIDTPPDVAFPPSLGGRQLPDVGNCGDVCAPPFSTPSADERVGTGDPNSTADPFRQLNFMERVTPFDLELEEIKRSEGEKAMFRRIDQFEREELRRKRTADTRDAHRRYSALAFHRNLERLAEKIADEKLARLQSGKPSDQQPAASKPPTSASALPPSAAESSRETALSPAG